MAILGTQHDPYQGFKFHVSYFNDGGISGEGCFSKVSGLEAEVEVAEYRCGTDPITNRKIPGLATYPAVVLERGLSSDTALYTWYRQVIGASDGQTLAEPSHDPGGGGGGAHGVSSYRGTVTVDLIQRDGSLAWNWTFKQAWPSKYTPGEMDASSSDVMIESAEIQHEGMYATVG